MYEGKFGERCKGMVSDDEVEITAEKINGAIKVRVADNGPGIPAEYHDAIFEKFGRVRQKQDGRMFSFLHSRVPLPKIRFIYRH